MRAIRIRYFDDCHQRAQLESVLATYGIRDSRHFPTAMMCWAIVNLPPERKRTCAPSPRATGSRSPSSTMSRRKTDMTAWIIVVGTLGNLEKVVGPFDTESGAREFAHGYSSEDRYEDWLSMPLTAPADEEEEDEGDAA